MKISDIKLLEMQKYYEAVIAADKSNRSDFDSNLQEWWNRHLGIYSCKKDKNFPWPGSADIQTGLIKIADAGIEARFYASLNAVKKINITAQTTKEAKQAAEKISHWFNNYWIANHPTDLNKVLRDFFQCDVVEGVGFLAIEPDRPRKPKKAYKRLVEGIKKLAGYVVGDSGKFVTEDRENRKYLGATWKHVPGRNIGFDEMASTISECGYVYWEKQLSKSDCLKYEKTNGWINIDKVFPKEETNPQPQQTGYTDNDDQDKNDYIGVVASLTTKKSFYDMWAEYDVNDDGIPEYCHLVLSKDGCIPVFYEVLEDSFLDKRRPFVSAAFYGISGKIRGQGNPQRLAKINDEADALQNQGLDNNTWNNTVSGVYVPTSGYDPDRMRIVPGKFAPVKDVVQIKQFQFATQLQNIQYQTQYMDTLFQRQSLINDYNLGRESQLNKNPTATGTIALIGQSKVNLDPLMQNLQNALNEAVKQTIECLYEFMPVEGIKYAVISKDVVTTEDVSTEYVITREDLEYRDEFIISCLGGIVDAMLETDKQTIAALWQMFGQDQSGEVNVSELKRKMIETYAPMIAKDILREPAEIQALKMIEQKQLELSMLEQQLAGQNQALLEQRNVLIGEAAKMEEQKFVDAMEREGVPIEERNQRLNMFRQAMISRHMAGANERGQAVAQPEPQPQVQQQGGQQ